ncbi:MAG: transposase [Planctomycetota bacterium]
MVDFLHLHLDGALCEEVFEEMRSSQRRRVWTLERLAEFWTAVVLRAPASLTQAVEEAAAGQGARTPHVPATPQAFFARCQTLRWEFFHRLFHAFSERALRDEPPRFLPQHQHLLERFPGVWVVDGSGLDAVAHRLKLLWDDRAVVLPGTLLAFYDVFHGVARHLEVHPDATAYELHRAEQALPAVPRGTLVVGDRHYGVPQFFDALATHGLFGLAQRPGTVAVSLDRRLRRSPTREGTVEEWEVTAGRGPRARHLRLVRWRKGAKSLDLLTDVLDSERLPAHEALALYRERWTVERLFYDLKEVLNLRRFYAANTNAVAMQVYASALVHTALRVAQGRLAEAARIPPETLSVAKLFPRLAAASRLYVGAQYGYLATCAANPGQNLREPDYRTLPFASTALRLLVVRPRRGPRRKRRYCPARRTWRPLLRSPRRRRKGVD